MSRKRTKIPTIVIRQRAGERLKAVRGAYGMTQQQAGDCVDITQDMWSKLERGERPIEDDLAFEICNRFHITLDWLYRGLAQSAVEPELLRMVLLTHPHLTLVASTGPSTGTGQTSRKVVPAPTERARHSSTAKKRYPPSMP